MQINFMALKLFSLAKITSEECALRQSNFTIPSALLVHKHYMYGGSFNYFSDYLERLILKITSDAQ